MPRYALLIYDDETRWQALSPQEQKQIMSDYYAYTDEVRPLMAASEALHPTSAATTVEVHEGRTVTTDGPFAETKEQLGGFYLLTCDSKEQAIAWAAKIPSTKVGGKIEVRECVDFPPPPE